MLVDIGSLVITLAFCKAEIRRNSVLDVFSYGLPAAAGYAGSGNAVTVLNPVHSARHSRRGNVTLAHYLLSGDMNSLHVAILKVISRIVGPSWDYLTSSNSSSCQRPF